MSKYKLITEDKDCLYLISDKEDGSILWRGNEVVAYKRITNNAWRLPLPELPDLPQYEEDVTQDAMKDLFELKTSIPSEQQSLYHLHAFIEGYKAASKKYSNADLKSLLRYSWERPNRGDGSNEEEILDEWKQSLSPTLTPINFIPELIDGELKIENNIVKGKYIF